MRKLNELGYTKIEILVIVILLGVVAFITINQTSYAFSLDSSKSIAETKRLIEMQAEDYALANLNIFSGSNVAYITVNDLVESHYLIGNNEGLVTNPANTDKSFNDNKVKLEYNQEENKVVASLLD